jgi:hypothetical protein
MDLFIISLSALAGVRQNSQLIRSLGTLSLVLSGFWFQSSFLLTLSDAPSFTLFRSQYSNT